MEVYIYAADIYCKECGEAIRKEIAEEDEFRYAKITPSNPDNEWSYDSGEFPKGPYPDGGGEADCPQHCGSGPECHNAIELPDGTKVGAWLENELTMDGLEYVKEAIREGGEVAEMWNGFYCDYDLDVPTVEPHVPENTEEVEGYISFPFPNLGSDYESDDWEEEERWFVDSSGFGSPSEPAWTVDHFKEELLRYHTANPDHGYGLVSEGQFQVWVAAFSPVRIKQES